MVSGIEKQKISIKGIFRRGDKFLLLKQINDIWELPGGKLELGEQIDECFSREMSEELGWHEVKVGDPTHVWTIDGKDNKTQCSLIAVTAGPRDEPIVLSDEHTEYGWFSLLEIETLTVRSTHLINAIKKSIET